MASTIAYDTSTDGGFSAGTTLTFSHTIGAGSNTYLFVGILTLDSTDLVTGVTYNGTSMTRIEASASDANDGEWSYIYGLAAPTAGAHNVIVSKSSAGGGTIAAAISYSGVKQTTQPDNSAKATANSVTSITANITTANNNCWLLGFFRAGTNQSVSAGTTARANAGGSPSCLFVDSNGGKSPAGAYSLGTTFSSSFSKYIILSIKDLTPPATGGFMFYF